MTIPANWRVAVEGPRERHLQSEGVRLFSSKRTERPRTGMRGGGRGEMGRGEGGEEGEEEEEERREGLERGKG